MSFFRRHFVQLLTIGIGVAVLVSTPTRADAEAEEEGGSGGPCVWCRTSCPQDLTDYCERKNCPVLSTTCSNATGCQGVVGEWFTYKITCANPS